MATSSFLTKLIGNVWSAVIILLICIGASIYYFLLPADSIINILGTRFTPELSRTLIIVFVFTLGLLINFSINIITGHLQKEKTVVEGPKEPQVIVPPIEIKNIINTQPETKTADTAAPANHKFYPNYFLPELKFFVGRTEVLKKITETLAEFHRASIHDISGLGKTFTTYKFANDNKDNYDKIFFIRATKEEMMESLAKCGEMVNAQLANVEEQKAKALGFKQWLEENENWLVIYDNVDLPAELFPFVPVNKSGDCVFTSNFREAEHLGTIVDVKKLNNEDAGILLYSRANNKPDSLPDLAGEEKEAFDNLLKEIDGLPLTLNSTGAFVFNKNWTFEKFWQKYQNAPKIVWESEDDYSTYQRKSAGIVFSLAYEELSQDTKVGRAVRILLNAMSFLSPDEIPEDLLQEILRKSDKAFADLKDGDDHWDDVRRGLTGYDLLKYNKDKCTFTTHRSIQRVIQTKLATEEIKNVCAISKSLRNLFPTYDHFNRAACEKYSQHVQTLLETSDSFDIEDENSSFLHNRLGRYQELLGNFNNAERFYRCSSEISGKITGKESAEYAARLNNLANVYRVQGRYDEAVEKFEEALRIDEKTVGKEPPGYDVRLNNLANAYRDQGRYDEAIKKYEEALQIAEKTIGKEHPDYAVRLNNLASVYLDQGREKKKKRRNTPIMLSFYCFNRHEAEKFKEALGKRLGESIQFVFLIMLSSEKIEKKD